jgi:hypothetical protein
LFNKCAAVDISLSSPDGTGDANSWHYFLMVNFDVRFIPDSEKITFSIT